MKKLSQQINQAFSDIEGLDQEALAKAYRVGQIRALWAELVEESFLRHTNGVYILKDGDKVVMRVYVDESIYAAELNNRRELLQLQCQERFGKPIDEFQIFISHGLMKQRHPFTDMSSKLSNSYPTYEPRELTNEDLAFVEEQCSNIENPTLRQSFRKAMIADLAWKKSKPQ